jgi:hypothetical protein
MTNSALRIAYSAFPNHSSRRSQQDQTPPKHVDITPLEGDRKETTFKCIYTLEKDEFTLALPSKDGKRPTEYSTGKEDGGAGQVVVWRRVK